VQRNEHRDNPRGLADLLLPHALIDDGILLQQDGSLLTGWTYRGPDMMSAAPAEMDALSARLNSVAAPRKRVDAAMRRDPVAGAWLSGARGVSRQRDSPNRR